MKQSTIVIILVVGIAALVLFGGFNLNLPEGGPSLNVYTGRVKMNLVQLKRIDGTAYETTNTQMRVIHGSMDYNDKVGTLSSNTITGDLKEADKGYWYLILDYGTNNTDWLDSSETLKDPYVTRTFGFDGDQDGFDEECVELYFGGLSALQAGESYKEVEVSLIFDPARTSSVAFTSLTNASSVSVTAYEYKTLTGYTTGVTEGDLLKIAKVEIVTNSTGDIVWENSSCVLTHLKLGPYTWTSSEFGSFDDANDRFQLKFGDQINSQGGRDLFYAKNAGTLWASYEMKIYVKGGDETYNDITIKIYLYKPDGSVTAAFSRIVEYDSA